MAQVEIIIYQEFKPGYTTGKEIERLPFKSQKEAFEWCRVEREKEWGEFRSALNWWEIKDKKVALPNEGKFRKWAVIAKA